MFLKPREIPIQLQKEDALLRLLPKSHPKYDDIKKSTQKGWAGYRGEKELDYQLSFLPANQYYIIPHIRIPIDSQFFQIDTLILCSNFALLIESKNIYGTLHFDYASQQVTRTYKDQTEGFSNPIQQVKRQKFQFQRWLNTHFKKIIPCHHLVSIGFPKTIVKAPNSVYQHVLHAEHIPEKIAALHKLDSSQNLTTYMIKKISNLLIEHNTPLEFDVIEYYKIQKNELLTGILCPQCARYHLRRAHSFWECPSCDFKSHEIHVPKINDFLTIFGQISIQECHSLMGLSSRHTARRILQSMNLTMINKGRSTIYKKPVTDAQHP
ncbi:nuclease-related domain-containing protein [Bacillus carboniphilus]|uniref:Nuclease-related domain-containing protein n=1 Tax=Bacillus carboniphilus TaxID=86663 RepID=A0ABN0WRT9_9BACI